MLCEEKKTFLWRLCLYCFLWSDDKQLQQQRRWAERKTIRWSESRKNLTEKPQKKTETGFIRIWLSMTNLCVCAFCETPSGSCFLLRVGVRETSDNQPHFEGAKLLIIRFTTLKWLFQGKEEHKHTFRFHGKLLSTEHTINCCYDK